MVHILMTNAQHCNKPMEIMKKEQTGRRHTVRTAIKAMMAQLRPFIVQELCESRGGRPGLSVLASLLVSVDVKNY